MPSTYSISNSSPRDSSTVMAPSLPTLSITSPMRSPMCSSLAEIEAICAISSRPRTCLASLLTRSTTIATAVFRPRLMIMGLAPAATLRSPALMIAWASTVAVVVPSPATSLVLLAASLISCAPMSSKLSSRSMSLATVTPSWVTMGPEYFLPNATLRPLGPSVVLTALATVSIPLTSLARASVSSRISFGILSFLRLARYRCVRVGGLRQTAGEGVPTPRQGL